MIESDGYSLWLAPEGDTFRRFADLISGLSEKFSSPKFDPHVTLLGGIQENENEIFNKIAEMASGFVPVEVRLTILDSMTPRERIIFHSEKNQYFRCLFIRADRTEDLVKLYSKAAETFNIQEKTPFVPHLSIMYGSLDQRTKREIISEVGSDFNSSFRANSIKVVCTKGKPEEWYVAREIKLGRKS